jgi:hypothetical protein
VQWWAGAGGLQCLASVGGCQRAVGLLVWFGILTKWLSFKAMPERSDLPSDINESLIIELYSK